MNFTNQPLYGWRLSLDQRFRRTQKSPGPLTLVRNVFLLRAGHAQGGRRFKFSLPDQNLFIGRIRWDVLPGPPTLVRDVFLLRAAEQWLIVMAVNAER